MVFWLLFFFFESFETKQKKENMGGGYWFEPSKDPLSRSVESWATYRENTHRFFFFFFLGWGGGKGESLLRERTVNDAQEDLRESLCEIIVINQGPFADSLRVLVEEKKKKKKKARKS